MEDVRETLRTSHGGPKQRYKYPITSSQEIGWFEFDSQRPQTARKLWHHPLNSNPITQFAANYERSQAINPFKVREKGAMRAKETDIPSTAKISSRVQTAK